MYALDPDIAIPSGPPSPVAADAQPDIVVPDTEHAVTEPVLAFVTNMVEPEIATPYG
jgi:hypothetical protein